MAKAPTKSTSTRRAGYKIGQFNLLYFLIACSLVFSFLEPRFASSRNLIIVLRQASVTGIFGFALTFVVVSGEFDLSFAAVGGFVGTFLSVYLLTNLGYHMYLCWILGLLVGLGLSFVNFVNVRRVGIPSFIATLGMMSLLNGVSRRLSGGGMYWQSFWPKSYALPGRGFVGPLPNSALLFVIVAVVVLIVMEYTRRGRYLYAVGGNPEVARHVGINVDRMKLGAFLAAGGLSSLAGIITSSQMGQVGPDLTSGFLMPAITVVFLGSIFLKGGVPNIWGTLVAAILMAVLSNGLTLAGVPTALRNTTQGALLLVSLIMAAALRARSMYSVEQ